MKIKQLAPLAALTILAAACNPSNSPQAEQTTLTIKGSDTMVHLVAEWAEAYMQQYPELDISVTGGGTGTGIAGLLNGALDICAASREMTKTEIEKAAAKDIAPHETIVGRDAIAVIVHTSNPVTELSMEQLRKIFTGSVSNWAQVGGSDEKIQILSRETSSGTYVFFQEHVLNKQDFAAETLLMPATSSIIQSVTTDASAIGYVGLGYAHEAADKVKVVPIQRDEHSPAVTPSSETVTNSTYSISRPLYFYTNGLPQGAARDFIDFCLSPAGQQIVEKAGYVRVQ